MKPPWNKTNRKEDERMFYALLKKRRSIRKFSDRAVEPETLDTILKSALLSPSSRSRRPWEFVVVTDPGMLGRLAESREHGSQFLSGAKAGVVVVADPGQSDVWIEDASIASVIMQLTAESLGLGSCWIQIRQRQHDGQTSAEAYVKELLQIPAPYCVACIIALGYPAETKQPYEESALLYNKIHREHF